MIGRGEGSLSRAGVKKSKSESKNLNIDCQEILISNSASIFNLFSLTTVPKYWCTLFIAKVSHEGITSFRSSTCIMSWNVNTPKYCSPQKLLFWQLGKRRMSMLCRQKKGYYWSRVLKKTRDGAILLVFTLLGVQMTVWYLEYVHCISANTDVFTVSFGEAKENNMC